MLHITERIPFEIWREVFLIVYNTRTHISHPPSSKYELSRLNARLNVHRTLSLVSRLFHSTSLSVFLEDLELYTVESLKGASKTVNESRTLARSLLHVSFSFYEFRCSISNPRRARVPIPGQLSEADRTQQALSRTSRRNYRPSVTMQSSHWRQWHSHVAYILNHSPSISQVFISFSSDHTARGLQRSGSNYATLFPVPDLDNQGILTGLRGLENLRTVRLVDPAPLAEYGPAMKDWKRLRDIKIELSRPFKELAETAFIPPRHLESFTFLDWSPGIMGGTGGGLEGKTVPSTISWPTSSDLARCTNLTRLELGVAHLENATTVGAIAFLIYAYRDTLQELVLRVETDRHPSYSHNVHQTIPSAFLSIFSFPLPIKKKHEKPRFAALKTLRLMLDASSSVPSGSLGGIETPSLEHLHLSGILYTPHGFASEAPRHGGFPHPLPPHPNPDPDGMDDDDGDNGNGGGGARPPPPNSEELRTKWRRFFAHRNFSSLKVLQLNTDMALRSGGHHYEYHALRDVAGEMGVAIRFGRDMGSEVEEDDEEDEDGNEGY